MIKSMTGFGRCELSNEKRKLTVEMKAVNHRYLDINIKMPKKLYFFENAIRNFLKEDIQRGKVDVYITYEDYTDQTMSLLYHPEIAKEYVEHIRQMAFEFQLEPQLSARDLARFPEVLTLEEQTVDEQELWELLQQALNSACQRFVTSRETEGENLRQDLISKLDGMLVLVDEIALREPQILEEYRNRLENKVQELLGDTKIEEARLASEVILFADKICTDEELVRLKSHISSTKESLLQGGGVGRKLDFIAQEMNREANTILSKANDLTVSKLAIELKTEIEKVREQIQNIE